jgi:hypothetical protein
LGCAAEPEFQQPRIAISTHDQQIGAEVRDTRQEHVRDAFAVRRNLRRFSRDAVTSEVRRRLAVYAKAFDGDFPVSIVVVERESDFESDLVMRNLAVFDMAARLHHFEPANLPQRARRTPDGGLDRVLDALFRRARNLDDSVNMVRHRHPPLGQWLGLPDLKRLQALFSRLAYIKWTPSF